jgi:hypothetical protein
MSDPASTWAGLARAALVGIERMPFQAPALPADLAGFAPGAVPAEQALLRAAAVLAPFLKAGQEPATLQQAARDPAHPDTLAPGGPRASHALGLMLGGEHEALLPEWCEAAATARRRVPDHLLPQFLERMTRVEPGARPPALAALLGERGRWLSLRNPAWRALINPEPTESSAVWHAGTRAERLVLMRSLRACDPDAARALLESTRESEAPEDLAALVDALGVGSSMADQAFLETLLDAKHKPVRVAAARLLARLPGSELGRRMILRVAPLVSYTPPQAGLLKKRSAVLEVKLPEDLDAKQLTRDGIDTNRKRGKLGPKAVTLLQIIAATPLAHWQRAFGAMPATLIEAAAAGEWAEALMLGWVEACVSQGDEQWAGALLAHLSGRGGGMLKDLDSGTLSRLFARLAAAQREAFLIDALEARPKAIHDDWVLELLAACTHAWSEDFSRRFLAVASCHCLVDAHWRLRAPMPTLATHLFARIADEAARGWPTDSKSWQPADQAMLDQLVAIVELRKAYLEELTP